jgi:hypothetical protein
MSKKLLPVIAALALAMPLFSLEKGADKQEKKPSDMITTWQEIVLEDFETTPYTNKDISFKVSYDQEAGLTIRSDQPATANSKKYLGIKVKTRGSDTFVIKPPKEITTEKFCRSISFWVYGEKTYGELSFMLQDATNVNHRLVVVPIINFEGWKHFTVLLTNAVKQGSGFQNQKRIMKIINIQYRTTLASTAELPARWEYLYLDDITATVKEQGTGKQSDQW